MAGIRIHGPDGSAFNFPEGTTEDDIAQAMDAHYGASQGGQSAQGQSGWDAAALGALDTLTFGYLDEAGSGLDWLADKLPGGRGRGYDEILATNRGQQKGAQEAHPNAYLAGQIGGGVLAGVGTAGAGLSMAANAARGGAGLARVAGGAAVDGLAMGALQGSGSGEGLEDRAWKAGVGAIGGLATGAAAPYATAAGGAVLRAATAPIAARLAPGRYADEAIGATIRRSGLSTDDVARQLEEAGADGQGMFTVADALGREGSRRLSSVVRTPNDARQGVVDALTDRSLTQNERLASTLAEGFDAPDTAAQRTAALTARRSADADVNYGAARASAGAVDPTPAIQVADDFLRPGMLGGLAPDSIEAAVTRARSYLTDGQSILSDFNAALRSKQEMDAMIEGAAPAVQRQLIPIRNALDDSLAAASTDYSGARDIFRQQSRAIDAVGTGTAAASGRTRAADNIAAFQAMTPEEQAAFRAGYASPIIAGVEASPVGPTTDRARALMTGKSAQEFPAFAAPGRGEQMTNRIARERRMSETNRAALGGSMTADNIADQNDLAQFDPGIIATAATSGPTTALMSVVARALNEGRGMPPQVANRVAQALMETDPARARAALTTSSAVDQALAARNARIIAALNATSAAGTGRLAAP